MSIDEIIAELTRHREARDTMIRAFADAVRAVKTDLPKRDVDMIIGSFCDHVADAFFPLIDPLETQLVERETAAERAHGPVERGGCNGGGLMAQASPRSTVEAAVKPISRRPGSSAPWPLNLYGSAVGKKWVMAITGMGDPALDAALKKDPEAALPLIIGARLPHGLVGFMLAALLSGFLATFSSTVNGDRACTSLSFSY